MLNPLMALSGLPCRRVSATCGGYRNMTITLGSSSRNSRSHSRKRWRGSSPRQRQNRCEPASRSGNRSARSGLCVRPTCSNQIPPEPCRAISPIAFPLCYRSLRAFANDVANAGRRTPGYCRYEHRDASITIRDFEPRIAQSEGNAFSDRPESNCRRVAQGRREVSIRVAATVLPGFLSRAFGHSSASADPVRSLDDCGLHGAIQPAAASQLEFSQWWRRPRVLSIRIIRN